MVFVNGGWVVMFESNGFLLINGQDDVYYDIYICFYNVDGMLMGLVCQIILNIIEDYYLVDMVMLLNGQLLIFVVCYEFGGIYDIFVYCYIVIGQQVGVFVWLVDNVEVYVNSIIGVGYIDFLVVVVGNGIYVIVWYQELWLVDNQVGYLVFIQFFCNDGMVIGLQWVVVFVMVYLQEFFGLDQMNGQIEVCLVGGFVLGWNCDQFDSLDGDVYFWLLDCFVVGQMQVVMVNMDCRVGDQVLQDVVDLGGGCMLVIYFNQIFDVIDDIFDGG